jgi:lipoprotein-anchoring transpeptidase ErfK/SrfK
MLPFGIASEARLERAEAMNVVESRDGRPLRLRPWVLLVGAAVVVAAIVVVVALSSSSTNHAAAPPSTKGGSSGSGGSGGSNAASTTSFFLKSATPAQGTQNVPPNTPITLTFSAPVSLQKVAPTLSPSIAGKWVQPNATTLTYALDSPLIPYTQEVVTIPGGTNGLVSKDGATLSSSHTVAFGVAAGDTLRLQQLLAQLNYLPVGFSPSGPAPTKADLAVDQPGTFSWRWPSMPTELTSQWTQGTMNEITKAAIEDFENQNNIGVDGEAGPTVWTALLNDVINDKPSATPYVYVLVNKVVPQSLTLWNNGVVQYTVPINSGAPGADTTDGSYAVFEHVRFSDMKGTNVDGSTYNDPNVPYASYFNGGDALHGFIRASYGSPQSNGCVEMSYANAALVWPLTPIGTLVTVEGPNFGTAPPPTTTTTTTAPPATTTTAPPAPAATTTTVAAAPAVTTGSTP